MLTKETNERLTQTGPGTPGGDFLRRYWFPVAAVSELEKEPVLPVRILSEDLTLFRDLKGHIGLIADRCAHRAIRLAYGIPQENGLRCAYHGWTYNTEGRVVDMPFEPACLPLKVTSYPVEVLGGLVFAYLGQEPRPLLPRWEAFAREDLDTRISFHPLPCNWVQCMDNSMDPIHFEHLHGHYGNYLLKLRGEPPGIDTDVIHLKIDFDVREPGLIYKRRLLTGESADNVAWTVGHPIVFPYMLCSATGGLGFQIRVPIDETHTVHIGYGRSQPKEPGNPRTSVAHVELEYDDFGRVNRSANVIVPQDMMAWVAQGPVSDRTREHLATSDKGVILYHNLILQGIERVQRGGDPVGVIRDRAVNEPMIKIPTSPLGREHEAFYLPGRVRDRV
jgi:5,5'-dehydrodivanillate O-demethylase